MSDSQEFAALHRLASADAVAYMHDRGWVTQTFSWQDLWQDEHAAQFTVSRLARADLLADVHRLISESVAGELGRTDFLSDAKALLAEAGWWGEKDVLDPLTGEVVRTRFDPARLKLILDTNVRGAHAAGQWARIQRTKGSHPYLRYVTARDDKVRPAHRMWDNLTLPVDDAFWHAHFPPNGWRCRCRVVSMKKSEYEGGVAPGGSPLRKGAPKWSVREWVNRRTGAIERLPLGIDPGFGYNVGRAREEALKNVVRDKGEALPAALAGGVLSDLAKGPVFARWMVAPAGHWPLARLPTADAEALGARGRVALLSAETMSKQAAQYPDLDAADYAAAQSVIDGATIKVSDGRDLIYLREEATDSEGGQVMVVKTALNDGRLFITSLRRLSRQDASRDTEVSLLLRKVM